MRSSSSNSSQTELPPGGTSAQNGDTGANESPVVDMNVANSGANKSSGEVSSSSVQNSQDDDQFDKSDGTKYLEDYISDVVEENGTQEHALWKELSESLSDEESQLGEGSSLNAYVGGEHAFRKHLFFIQAFFVLCEKLNDSSYEDTSTSDSVLTFSSFTKKHVRILNAFIRRDVTILEDSLSAMLKVPSLIDFDNKRAYFRYIMEQQKDGYVGGPVEINVRREHVVEDSYNQISMLESEDLNWPLRVHFRGEEDLDECGFTGEWFKVLSDNLFDNGALVFTPVADNATSQPNLNTDDQTEQLSFYKFVGRVVSKALFDEQLLDAYFTPAFYKLILGVEVTTHHDIGVELNKGGHNTRVIEVTANEIKSFLEGFHLLIPQQAICIFDHHELALVFNGIPEMKGNTVYVDEPATNVKFQKLLRLSEFPYSLLLIGTGFREVFSLNYKFYAAAFYMNPLILDNLEPWKGRSAAEIQRDSSLFGFIYQAPLEKSLKIVPVLDISGEMCWDVLVGAVFRRFKSPTSSVDFIALSTFHDILTNCSLKKGCSIFLTWPQPSKLLLHLSAEGIPSAAVATIQSESVAHCLFDVFFGRGPVSPSLKASVSKGIASILK